MKTTFDALKEIMVRDYELSPDSLTPETPLEEIDIDSLAVIELMFALEDEFDVIAEDAAAGDYTTLGDIADYIDELIAERGSGSGDKTATTKAAARE
jgi:acyl carrier protein